MALLAHTWEVIEPFPMQFFLSNQRVSASPVNLPKCGAHRAFQNPKDIERLGQGLPSKAQSSTCTPVPGGSLGVHGILSFSPEHLGDFLREPVQMPTPGPPPPAPGEGLGEAGKSASPLSTRASRNPVAWLLLGFHFSFSFSLFLPGLKPRVVFTTLCLLLSSPWAWAGPYYSLALHCSPHSPRLSPFPSLQAPSPWLIQIPTLHESL